MNQIGVMLNNLERDRLAAFEVAVHEGFQVVDTNALYESWLTGPQRKQYIEAARRSGLTIAAMFIGFDGQDYSSIESVTNTVGLLAAPELRQHRIQIALHYCELAADLGVPALAMHLGFMPRQNSNPEYAFLVEAVRRILDRCAELNQSLHLETGQESARELMQFIKQVDRENLGVNFDPANFILYDTDDPLEALSVLRAYVRGVHCKDGIRPTKKGMMGQDVPLGSGEVNFPRFISLLNNLNYDGPLIIERESGPNVREEIRAGRAYLQELLRY